MAKTTNITVTNSAESAITTTIPTRKVRVKENPNVAGWPSTSFNLRAPLVTSAQLGVPAGGSHTFDVPFGDPTFVVGSILGYIKAVDVASTTVSVYEE